MSRKVLIIPGDLEAGEREPCRPLALPGGEESSPAFTTNSPNTTNWRGVRGRTGLLLILCSYDIASVTAGRLPSMPWT